MVIVEKLKLLVFVSAMIVVVLLWLKIIVIEHVVFKGGSHGGCRGISRVVAVGLYDRYFSIVEVLVYMVFVIVVIVCLIGSALYVSVVFIL